MELYNPKEWLRPVIYFHKSDTFRKLFGILVVIGAFTGLIAYIELVHLQLSGNSYVRNIPLMHGLLGFAISMLLVFRTNTAYDRWWEGRKLWGQLINNSRNLTIKINTMLPLGDKNSRVYFKHLIIAFPDAFRLHLQKEKVRLELDEDMHPEIPEFDTFTHAPLRIAEAMQSKLQQLYRDKVIDGHQMELIDRDISSYMDICGACERIKNTPIPYTYSAFIKKFIFIYTFTLPFGYVFSLGYYAIPIVMFIFYVLASLEIIAEEIEDPFGKDINDLPMKKLSEVIKNSVNEVLDLS